MAEIWGAVASGVAAVGSAAMNKGTSTTTQDPGFLKTAKEDLVQRSTDLSNRTQDKYTGPRIATMSNNEQSALELAGKGSEQQRSLLGKAEGAVDDSMKDYSSENISKYMNPYTEAVLQPQIREQNRQYDRESAKLANSKAGAFGGDRAAFEQSALERNQREGIADVTGKTYKDAFDAANQNFFNDSKRKQAAADTYSRVGDDYTKMNTTEIQNLMATGGVDRLLKQANLDTAYSDFLETRDWDVNNLDILKNAISTASGNTTTTRKEPSNVLGTILGAGATIAGAYFGGKVDSSYKPYGGEGGGISADSALDMSLRPVG